MVQELTCKSRHITLSSVPDSRSTASTCTHSASQRRRPHHAHETQAQQGYTHWGKGANLFDVLFVTLRAGRPPRCSSGVPERVIILQGVLSWPWDNCLRNRKLCLSLMNSSEAGMEIIIFTASEVHTFLPPQIIKQTSDPYFHRKKINTISVSCLTWNIRLTAADCSEEY